MKLKTLLERIAKMRKDNPKLSFTDALATFEGVDVTDDDGAVVKFLDIKDPEQDGADDEALAATIKRYVDDSMKAIRTEVKGALRITGGEFRNDDEEKWGWKSANEQLLAIKAAACGQGMDPRLMTKATGMSEGVAADGGFLLAPEFSNRVMEIAHAENTLLSMTDNYSIGSNSVKVNAVNETSRATGSRRGGIRGYWGNEGGTLTSSKPTVRQMTLSPHKLHVLVYLTDELLEDGGSMMLQLSERAAGEEIAFMSGDAIINGSGAGQPLGLLAGTAGTGNPRIEVAKETGQAAATIVKANIDKMWSRMHARSRSNSVWLINQDTEPQLENLTIDVGTGGVPVYLPPGGITEAPNARLKGRPVIVTEFNPTLGTVGDIMLVDLKQYLAVTKGGGVKASSSVHVAFLTDETAFKFTYRIDGQPWWNAPLTPYKGTATQSPFVALATRS